MQSFLFHTQNVQWAIDAQWVRSVVQVGEVTPVPLAPAGLVGAFAVRGRVQILLDLEAFYQPIPAKVQPMAVEVEYEEQRLMLACKQVEGFIEGEPSAQVLHLDRLLQDLSARLA